MRTIHAKRMLARVWPSRTGQSDRRVILYYHSIGGGPWATPADTFRQQMEWLVSRAEVVPLDSLLSPASGDRLRASITFDDGYASVADVGEPILGRLGLSGTVFINTGWIDEHRRTPSDPTRGHYPGEQFLSWLDVEKLRASGWSVGSHGVDHLDLTRVTLDVMTRELRDSKAAIESRLGCACSHFAYTWGRFTSGVRQAVRAAGYRTASSAIHGQVREDSDPFALPRIDVSNQYSLQDFGAIVRGEWDFMGSIQRLRRAIEGRR